MPESEVGYVLQCIAYDVQAGQCTQTAFLPPPTLLPPMSPEDANTIGVSFMGSVALVMAAKLFRRG
ncbi:hypothetical protein [Luteibacter sp.]|uniref:hypothetical protein n=1 Tax=Luteibacter sp. TaxID=1886636 RepID=UPI003F814425